MQSKPHITETQYAGHHALRLSNRHGSLVLALHGAHVLSWVPSGQKEVFWLSPLALPAPAAIRGGVPICWPWFGKEGMPGDAMAHGPVRNMTWQVVDTHRNDDEEISLSLAPMDDGEESTPLKKFAPGLQVRLLITLGAALRQSLVTTNTGSQPFKLRQALHSYFAISDPEKVGILGIQDLPYQDRLRDLAVDWQRLPFAFEDVCDRTYLHDAASVQANHRYTLNDVGWHRRLNIDTRGSHSLVVWNPGAQGAAKMVDVPNDGWQQFFCLEVANAGTDVVTLAPGAQHILEQTISLEQ